jgi:hypothetical protein
VPVWFGRFLWYFVQTRIGLYTVVYNEYILRTSELFGWVCSDGPIGVVGKGELSAIDNGVVMEGGEELSLKSPRRFLPNLSNTNTARRTQS